MPNDLPDLSRLTLSPDAAALFDRVADEATPLDRSEAHGAAAEELRAVELVARVEIGPGVFLMRTARGRAWGRMD